MANKIPGFDYVAGKPVAYTSAEWRAKYPPDIYQRATNKAPGETWYRMQTARGTGALDAEAYGIIPAGKVRA